MPVDKARFQALFGQYSQFDRISQKPFFYKEVQNFLRKVCEACVADQGWVKHLSLLPFDPYLVQSGSMDRVTDILVGTISVLSFGDLCSSGNGGIIVQQYREVAASFKRRWESSTAVLPVVDDAFFVAFLPLMGPVPGVSRLPMDPVCWHAARQLSGRFH